MNYRVTHHPKNLSKNPLIKRSNKALNKTVNCCEHDNSKAYGLPSKHDSECVRDLMNWKDGREERLKISEKYKALDIKYHTRRFGLGISKVDNNLDLSDTMLDKNKKSSSKSTKFREKDMSNMVFGMPSKISLGVEALISNQFAQFYDTQLEKKYREWIQKKKKKGPDGNFLKTHSKYYINQNKIDAIKSKTISESKPKRNFKLKEFTDNAKPKIDTSLKKDWRKTIPSPYIA